LGMGWGKNQNHVKPCKTKTRNHSGDSWVKHFSRDSFDIDSIDSRKKQKRFWLPKKFWCSCHCGLRFAKLCWSELKPVWRRQFIYFTWTCLQFIVQTAKTSL
jgi:hypothetical protein